MWPFKKQPEHRSYTDQQVALMAAHTAGNIPASFASTAALEACAGLVGRAFASARIEGNRSAALTPDCMTMIGRSLIRRGELVLVIKIEDDQVRLYPASSHDVQGGIDSWIYNVTISGPSDQVTQDIPAEGVIHLRYASEPESPWRGIGPLQVAVLAGKLNAEVAAALTDEAAGPRGSFLPMPVPGGDPTLGAVKDSIGSARGKMLTVESMHTGFGTGDPVRRDWEQKRFGPSPPQAIVQLLQQSSQEVYAACGLNPAIFQEADGTGMREAWRQALFGVIGPLGKIVQSELRVKLDSPELTLVWDELRASDLQGRARAFQSMVGGGMDISKAAALSGLMEPD